MCKKAVIIVAGGSGKRMGGEVPKQFLVVKGLPILMHTINCFYAYSAEVEIVVVLPEGQIEQWIQLVENYKFKVNHAVVKGGDERFFSVLNGLKAIKEADLVAVHDGVRPLVSQQTIKQCFDVAQQSGAVVPVVELVESIRQVNNQSSKALIRSEYRLVQTPQVFKFDVLQKAYTMPFSSAFTDDASVVEAAGFTVELSQGNRENIKVTTPMDLLIAEALL